MAKVTVNAPKTPVTEGSQGVAAATLPNVCKMPGPPAPFVPTPLPNIGRSALQPKDYSKSVTINGKAVAIRGASFGSQGDMASKATGGGIVSSNVHGPTKFIGPGSMNVKIEGKNVQLLGDQMLNNCGPSGSPANSATLMGVIQSPGGPGAGGSPKPCPGHEAGGAPHFPETDESFKDRRNALAKDQSPGGQHEHAAAKHNEPDIVRLEGRLNYEAEQKGEPRRSALSGKDDSQKVTHACKHCGAPMDGEIEHAIEDRNGKRHVVEAKSGTNFNPAKSQRETDRNIEQMKGYGEIIRAQGYGLIYKLPAGHDKAGREIIATAQKVGIPKNALQVIFI